MNMLARTRDMQAVGGLDVTSGYFSLEEVPGFYAELVQL